MRLLEKWFFLIWRWGSEAVSSLRFKFHFKTFTAKLTIEITPASPQTLSEYDEKRLVEKDTSNYSSFQNVQALLNVWYLWKAINMMIIIIIIIYSRQWYGVIDAQPNEIPVFK